MVGVSVVREDVEFAGAQGTLLRGWLYLPEGDVTPSRGLVMAHGLSATRRMALPEYAEVFRASGIAVLVYDHRNLGDSNGEPRQAVNPWAQSRDYLYAVSYLAARPEVDADRIAVWGSSFSGGPALVSASVDDRIKAVVASVPFGYVAGLDYADRTQVDARYKVIADIIGDESGAGRADKVASSLGPFPMVPEEPGGPGVLTDDVSREWFLGWRAQPDNNWVNEVTLQNYSNEFDPGACAINLAKPALFILAAQENLSGLSLEGYAPVFDRVSEPKRRIVLDGGHFCPYSGTGLAEASAATRDFLLEYL